MAHPSPETYAQYHRTRLAGRTTLVMTAGTGAYLLYLFAGGIRHGHIMGHFVTISTFFTVTYLARWPRWALRSVLGLTLVIAMTTLWVDPAFGADHAAWVAVAIVGLSALSPLPYPTREVQTLTWMTAIGLHLFRAPPGADPLDIAALLAATGVGWLVSWANVTAWQSSFENLEVQRNMSGRLGDARDALERAVQQTREELASQQARVVQNERLATLGRLAAGIAHEINNPLTVAITNLDLAATDREPALLDDARAALRRIRNIVSDLTRVARPGELEYVEILPIEPVIVYATDVVRIVAKGQVRIHADYGADVHVNANRGRLEQVLVNLLMNAWQAMAPRGTGDVAISTSIQGRHLHIVVDDNGPGIPEALLPEIFEPFFTTKPAGEGSGLGLAISRSYMQAMGGDLLVRPRGALGGARFIVEVPLPEMHAAAMPTIQRSEVTAPSTESTLHPAPTVLVIDDEPGLRRSLARALRREWKVITAANGTEALRAVREESVDVVLCDLILADEAGIEVLQRLSAERPELLRHTLLMTGEPGSSEWVEIARRNQTAVVRKPFDLGELTRRLREARLGHPQPLVLSA